MVWGVSLTVVLFIYTLLWDLYCELWELAAATGVNADVMGVLYAIHQYYPAAFFISITMWYLVQAQRKESF